IKHLPQGDVQRTNAAPHWRGQGTLDGNQQVADGIYRLIWQPRFELRTRLLARKHLVPCDSSLAAVSFLNRSIEHAHRRLPDVPPSAVAFDERDDRVVRHLVTPIAVMNWRAFGRQRHTVI